MKKIKLNNTNLIVSPVCLGTVNYGTDLSELDSKIQLSKFVESGGNFIDTAQIYGAWGSGPDNYSEYVIGKWFKETGKRHEIVLATKGAHPKWTSMEVPRVDAKCIEEDLDNSLKLLNTDYIDLYILHRDDRGAPVAQIMDCLDNARRSGKIKHYGCSNWTLPRIKEAQEYCKLNGLEGFVCNQLMWSLADINFDYVPDKSFVLMDEETRAYSGEVGMNVMAYMSIGKGYFTRRAAKEQLPSSVANVYNNPSNDAIFNFIGMTVDSSDYSYMDLALMYIMAEDSFTAVPIASFDNMEQLNEGFSCLNKPIPQDVVRKLAQMKKFIY
jgi:aryl-alcohol dehydrogenase-like predicted oxidoreductase